MTLKTRSLWVILALSGILFTQCSQNKAAKVGDFTNDIVNLDKKNVNRDHPIASFVEAAKEQASKCAMLNKSNIKALLAEARNHKRTVIVVGAHTMVKITDFTDCCTSNSWAAEMPYGTAMIQKDGVSEKSDYINQLVGLPDGQTRWMFMFD